MVQINEKLKLELFDVISKMENQMKKMLPSMLWAIKFKKIW
jgi:hypothetical protein